LAVSVLLAHLIVWASGRRRATRSHPSARR